MRTALKYIAAGLLCLALLLPCACTPEPTPAPTGPVETPTTDPAPAVPPPTDPVDPPVPTDPAEPVNPNPSPTSTGDVPALYPDQETELAYELGGQDLTIPAVLHHTHHGYTIVYDAMHYECRSYHEVDSYWSDEGLYLSVSIVYGMPLDYVLGGLQLQENIEMGAELTYIGSDSYPAYTLYTTENGLHRQFWALDYAGDTMLIEQSYPLDHEYAQFHRVIQLAMLDTLTLDDPLSVAPADAPARIAYTTALQDLYYNRILPDGSAAHPDDSFGPISDNRFAVYDIDNDGKEELILEYTTTSVAGMALFIYDYDETADSLHQQLLEFPNVQFFNNGMIEAGWSHNQGSGGAFWPYTLYQYDPASDTYASVGMVDAWDKSVKEDGFPDDADADGDGIVYYLLLDGDHEENTPVDSEAYLQWRNSYLENAEPLMLPFVDLTPENISGSR